MIISTHGIIASQLAGIDADAQAFFDRVTTAGGSLSATEKTAVNTLVLDLKGYSIWSKMKAIYPMVGASAAACAQNLKSSSFTGSFSSGWTFASTGVTPNGTSAYMDTNLTTNTNLSLNSTHIAYYSRTNTTVGNKFDFGSSSGSAELYICYKAYGTQYATVHNGGIEYNSLPNTLNLLHFNRTASNQFKIFKNGSLHQTLSVNSTSLNNLSNYLGCINFNGNADLFTNRECSWASLGDGLTDTEASNFYTAVQAFQTTLSRQV
jgi:hypothetical protein